MIIFGRSKKKGSFDSQNENQELLFLMKYIKKKNITVSGSPYLLENSLNRSGMKNQQKAYKALLYFFTYLRINEEEISSELNDIQPNEEDYILADKAWHQMRDLRDNYINLEKRVKSIYCFLIKMFSIYYGTKKSSSHKLFELTVFINEKLGFYYEYGMMLAYWYFNNNEKVKHFFEKVQPSSKDVLQKIENIAWDLFHLCNMPSEMAGFTGAKNVIILQSLITGDVALANIAKMNPISRMAFFDQEAQVKYRYSLKDISGDEEILNMIRDNEIKRESMCEGIDFIKLARELEVELLSIFST